MDSVLKTSFFNKNILSHSFNGKKSLLKRRLINIKEGNLKKQSKLILIFICIFTFYHDNSKPVFNGAILN